LKCRFAHYPDVLEGCTLPKFKRRRQKAAEMRAPNAIAVRGAGLAATAVVEIGIGLPPASAGIAPAAA
jgi:hypothetical protein